MDAQGIFREFSWIPNLSKGEIVEGLWKFSENSVAVLLQEWKPHYLCTIKINACQQHKK